MFLRAIVGTMMLAAPCCALAQQNETFSTYFNGLPAATLPLAGSEPMIVMQTGLAHQTAVTNSSVMPSGTVCPTLSTYQFFANTVSFPLVTAIDVFDGSQCLKWSEIDPTNHTVAINLNNPAVRIFNAPIAAKIPPSQSGETALYLESRSSASSAALGIVTRELFQNATGANGASWDVQSWSQLSGQIVQSAEIQPGFCDTANEYGDIDFNINNRNGAGGINQTIAVTACPSGVPSFMPGANDLWTLGTSGSEFLSVYSKNYFANGVQGVSCSAGTVSTATLTITNGIVTHC